MDRLIPLIPLPKYSHIPDFSLGDRLRRARESQGLTQAELAGIIEISQRSISSYEADETIPRLLTVRLWAAACQVNLAWLAWGDGSLDDPMPNTWNTRKMRATRGPTIWNQTRDLLSQVAGNAQITVAV